MAASEAEEDRSAQRVRSADVAREAGVSRATVSYVLNNTPGRRISDATKVRVLATAQRLGHVPHASARSLRLGRSNVVLALVSDFTFGYVRDQTLEALDTAMTKRGYVFLVHRYSETLRPLAELWPLIWPDVVVSMAGTSVSDALSRRDPHTKLVEAQPLLDQRRAGEMQAEYLFGKRHRRLGYAYPTNSNVRSIADERLAGTRTACERLGLRPPVVHSIDRNDVGSVTRALDSWKSEEEPITAICAHNDEIAVMLSMALTSRGLRVGHDLAVIGIDDIPISRLGISTVAIDIEQSTQRIVEHVLAAVENRPAKVSRRPVLRLVARASA
jgi:DNA-binding LacI/PurR family transcriptional regulator